MLPNFTWDIDPALVTLNLPLLATGLVLAGLGAAQALWSRYRSDREGLTFGVLLLLGGLFVAYRFNGEHFEWPIRYYSLVFLLVFYGGYHLLNWQLKRGGADEKVAGDFVVYGVIAVLAGARIGHVLFYDLDKALAEPMWVFQIWTGGLASHGATMGLVVAMWLFTKKHRVSFFEGADRFAFSAALGAALVRFGNFFNSEIVGRVTDGTWGVRFPRYTDDHHFGEAPLRHPSQLYEFFMGLAILAILWLADRAWGKEKRPRGALISLFFLTYFTGRFAVEFVKEFQTDIDADLLTMGQWLSIPGILLGIGGLVWAFRVRAPAGWVPAEVGPRPGAKAPRAVDPDVEAELAMSPEERRKRLIENERSVSED